MDLWQGCETQTIVNDTVNHTLTQQEQVTLFDVLAVMAFITDSTSSALEFVELIYTLQVSMI